MGKGKSSDFVDGVYQPAGIYGWRKQCLYATILLILTIVIMNLALTVWILRVLNFNIDGLNFGTITISGEGIKIRGQTEVLRNLYASNIIAKQNAALTIASKKGVKITSGNETETNNSFEINKHKITAICDSFEVRDHSGNSRFKVSEKGVNYVVDEVTYIGKAVFSGSIETPNIRGPEKGSLRLQSASSSILLYGKDRVQIEAPEGNVELKSSHDIIFNATKQISFNAVKLFMKNIHISTPNGTGKPYDDVYQVCMCQNGRVFLAPSSSRCVTEKQTCS